MEFNGVNYKGGMQRLFGFKVDKLKVDGEDRVTVNTCYYPCRRMCLVCMESKTFCSNTIHDSFTISRSQFEASLTRKRASTARVQNSPERQRTRETNN